MGMHSAKGRPAVRPALRKGRSLSDMATICRGQVVGSPTGNPSLAAQVKSAPISHRCCPGDNCQR